MFKAIKRRKADYSDTEVGGTWVKLFAVILSATVDRPLGVLASVEGQSHCDRPFSTMTCWGAQTRIRQTESLGGEGVLGLGGLGLLVSLGLVELHELGEIELGLLEDLDLLDEDVLKREDLGALLSDLLRNGVREAAIKY